MSAVFSNDRSHRFLLSRGDETKPYVLYIGLNPSDAGEEAEDPTTRRLHSFASREGFDHWKIANLSAFISSDPSRLRYRLPASATRENDFLLRACYHADLIVPCWGAGVRHLGFPDASNRPKWVIERACHGMHEKLHCFGRTKDGHPRHPLYLRADTPLEPWWCDLA